MACFAPPWVPVHAILHDVTACYMSTYLQHLLVCGPSASICARRSAAVTGCATAAARNKACQHWHVSSVTCHGDSRTCCGTPLQARNFVLELSMDQQVEQVLGTRTCEHCGIDTYEASLTCHSCKHKWEACAVSGYSVPPLEKVVAKSNLPARRDDWNAWVSRFQTDPITGTAATPVY